VLLISGALGCYNFSILNIAAIRSSYFSVSSMKDVFENVNAQSVIDFIKIIFITNYNLVIFFYKY